ncbi:MAG: PEGA domain-containing protein [Deltaproteobacteria bacterium]|nr:PEGA domain-containing protein [Deltaproteobacteria bacterium]
MNLRPFAFALVVALSPAILPTTVVEAQGEKADPFTDMARQRFQEGVKLYDAKKYEEARAAFLQAYALKKHPAVLLNLAQSELKSNHPVDAARHFSQYLQENAAASAAERKTAEQGLAEARLKTGRVQVEVNVAGAEVFVDDELVGKAPLHEAIDVGPGAHKVEARFSGYPNATGQVNATTGQVVALSLKLDKAGSTAAVIAPTAPPASSGGSEPGAIVPPAGTETPGAGTPPPGGSDQGVTLSTEGRKPFLQWMATDKVAWATGGVTVIGVGMGIIFSVLANSASSSADNIAGQIRAVASRDEGLAKIGRQNNPCADPVAVTGTDYHQACSQLKDNLDKRDTDKNVAIAGWVIGGVGAGATVVAYFLRSKPKPGAPPAATTHFVPVVTPAWSGLTFGGTF